MSRGTAPERTASFSDTIETVAEHIAFLERELDRLHGLATLGEITGLIAHELNNLLTPVRSYAQLALDREDPALTRKALERTLSGTSRVVEVIAALLELSGENKFVGVTANAAASPPEAFDQALRCLSREPERDNIELIREMASESLAAITPIAMHQVLLNLLLNARRALLPGGGRLVFRVFEESGPTSATWNMPRALRIQLEDSGCGIPKHKLATLFDPHVSHGEGGGAGLGLTVCKRLIEQAGGRIEVVSTLAVGTCFTITLPIAQSPRAAVSAAA